VSGDPKAGEDGESGGAARRKSAEDRRADILAAASALIAETRSLPLNMQAIGERIGASRALVYAHFTDQSAIVEAVLAEQFALIEAAGLGAATRTGDVAERGTRAAEIYLRHIHRHGTALHVILRDAPHGATLPPGATRDRNRALRALAGSARRDLTLSSEEAIVLVELLIAIPEELGRLTRSGDLALDDALDLCTRLVRSGIEALRPR
jgi:AcrR family transcriptional regulator